MIPELIKTSAMTGVIHNTAEIVFRNTQDIVNATPNAMKLPIVGFRNPKFHTLLMNEGFLDALRKNISVQSTLIRMGAAVTTNAFGLLDGFTVSTISAMRILDMVNALNAYYSLQFFGVQSISSGRGMTMLKDARISDYGTDIHRILSPYEYIIFNHPVHAVADGEVVEICNNYEDRVGRLESQAGTFRYIDKDDYIGNFIRIRHARGITSTYANIKKNSTYKRVGEKVFKGDMIARVGCSGSNRVPHLIFFLAAEANIIKLLNNFRITYRSMGGKWDSHWECPLVQYKDLHELGEDWDFFRSAVISRPKYVFNGSRLHELSLIKQYPEIKGE